MLMTKIATPTTTHTGIMAKLTPAAMLPVLVFGACAPWDRTTSTPTKAIRKALPQIRHRIRTSLRNLRSDPSNFTLSVKRASALLVCHLRHTLARELPT